MFVTLFQTVPETVISLTYRELKPDAQTKSPLALELADFETHALEFAPDVKDRIYQDQQGKLHILVSQQSQARVQAMLTDNVQVIGRTSCGLPVTQQTNYSDNVYATGQPNALDEDF